MVRNCSVPVFVFSLVLLGCGSNSSSSDGSASSDTSDAGDGGSDEDGGDSMGDDGMANPDLGSSGDSCAAADDRFAVVEVPAVEASAIANELAFALTPDDRPAIAYRAMEDGLEQLAYGERDEGGDWETTMLSGGPGHAGVTLAFSTDGAPHILHAASLPTPRTVLRVRTGDQWASTVVAAQASSKNALFEAVDGTVHGLFSEGSVVTLVRPDGDGNWETVWINTAAPDPVLGSSSGLGISGVYASDGVLHASHAVVGGALVHSSLEMDVPSNEEIGATTNEELTAIAMDSDGDLHVAFHRLDPSELVVASVSGGGWSFSTIEAGSSSAGLLIAESGTHHVFQIDAERNLRYGAGEDPDSISLSTVMHDVDRARYALDSMGNPHFVTRAADVVCYGRAEN